MIIKLLGAAMIVFSSSAIGYCLSKKDDYRIDDLEEMKRFLTIFKSEIAYSSMPIDESLFEISSRLNGVVAQIVNDAAEGLGEKRGLSAYEIWLEAVTKNSSMSYFSSDDIDNIIAFGRAIGYLDRNQQLNNIAITIEYIEYSQRQALKRKNDKGRLFKSAGILCGLLIAVILF